MPVAVLRKTLVIVIAALLAVASLAWPPSDAQAADAAITRVQVSKNFAYSGTTTRTTGTAGTLPTAATAGNLLVLAVACDKACGSVTWPAGFTNVQQRSGASITIGVATKVAAGGETSAGTFSWATAQHGYAAMLTEYSGASGANSSNLAPATYSDTAVTSRSVDPPLATVGGRTVVFGAIDTVGTATGFDPTASGYAFATGVNDTTAVGTPGLSLTERSSQHTAGTDPAASTLTWSTSDQVQMVAVNLAAKQVGVAPVASFTRSPSSGTAPLAVQFTDTSTGAPTSWSWNFGDSGTSTAQNPSHTYSAAGTYTVTLTATNTNGSSTATNTVTVAAAAQSRAPIGDLAGWHQVYAENFDTNAGPGISVQTTYPNILLYGDGWGNGKYQQDHVSVSGGAINLFLDTENGQGTGSAYIIKNPQGAGNVGGQTYGRYSMRFRADNIHYGAAIMQWPDSDVWSDGETDFPEGNFDSTIHAFNHALAPDPSVNSLAVNTGKTWTDWHVATTEWTPTAMKFYLDDVLIGTDTAAVSQASRHWVVQAADCSGTCDVTSSGNLQVDWAALYTYTPSPWTTVVDDQFNTGGVPAHWSLYDGPYGSDPFNCALPSQASVSNGAMHMLLSYFASTPTGGDCGAGWYSAGMMLSSDYAAIDQRITLRWRMTSTDPAYATNPGSAVISHNNMPMHFGDGNACWPTAAQGGEIDYMEGAVPNDMNTFIHYGSTCSASTQFQSSIYSADFRDWHTVRAERLDNTVKVYIDDMTTPVYTKVGDSTTIPDTLQRVVLQQECRASGCPATTSPTNGYSADVQVDWITVENYTP